MICFFSFMHRGFLKTLQQSQEAAKEHPRYIFLQAYVNELNLRKAQINLEILELEAEIREINSRMPSYWERFTEAVMLQTLSGVDQKRQKMQELDKKTKQRNELESSISETEKQIKDVIVEIQQNLQSSREQQTLQSSREQQTDEQENVLATLVVQNLMIANLQNPYEDEQEAKTELLVSTTIVHKNQMEKQRNKEYLDLLKMKSEAFNNAMYPKLPNYLENHDLKEVLDEIQQFSDQIINFDELGKQSNYKHSLAFLIVDGLHKRSGEKIRIVRSDTCDLAVFKSELLALRLYMLEIITCFSNPEEEGIFEIPFFQDLYDNMEKWCRTIDRVFKKIPQELDTAIKRVYEEMRDEATKITEVFGEITESPQKKKVENFVREIMDNIYRHLYCYRTPSGELKNFGKNQVLQDKIYEETMVNMHGILLVLAHVLQSWNLRIQSFDPSYNKLLESFKDRLENWETSLQTKLPVPDVDQKMLFNIITDCDFTQKCKCPHAWHMVSLLLDALDATSS